MKKINHVPDCSPTLISRPLQSSQLLSEQQWAHSGSLFQVQRRVLGTPLTALVCFSSLFSNAACQLLPVSWGMGNNEARPDHCKLLRYSEKRIERIIIIYFHSPRYLFPNKHFPKLNIPCPLAPCRWPAWAERTPPIRHSSTQPDVIFPLEFRRSSGELKCLRFGEARTVSQGCVILRRTLPTP